MGDDKFTLSVTSCKCSREPHHKGVRGNPRARPEGYITALHAAMLLHEQRIRIGNRGANTCVILKVEVKKIPATRAGIPEGELTARGTAVTVRSNVRSQEGATRPALAAI